MDAIKTGGLIAQVRKEKELTQKDLAEALHVSTQAVSKWGNGRSCPDVGLLEPLAEALDLTVTELLSGQRGEEPGEEAVRSSLRFGLEQLGPKIRKWRWLFILAALALAGVLLWVGYVWLRDNTEVLPQKETVVRDLDASNQDRQIAQAVGGSGFSLHLYEITLADGLEECTFQAELWTHGGMEQSWPLMVCAANDRRLFGPRRQLLVLSVKPHAEVWSEEEQRYTEMWFECGLNFAGWSTQKVTDTISNPYINGGAGWSSREEPKIVDPEEGAVLLALSIGGPSGGIYAPGELPPEHEEDVYLVIRMYCN